MNNTTTEDELLDAFVDFVNEDADKALIFITSLFVSYAAQYVTRRGEDSSKQITFEDTGGCRGVTIHAELSGG